MVSLPVNIFLFVEEVASPLLYKTDQCYQQTSALLHLFWVSSQLKTISPTVHQYKTK